MSRVFIVQNQHRWDTRVEAFVPKFDFTRAEKYGELVSLLSPTAAPFNPRSILDELRTKLRDYGDDDYLLLIGNPMLIGYTVAIAADINDGRVNLLQWSGSEKGYIAVHAEEVRS